jgi:hypothetical protein
MRSFIRKVVEKSFVQWVCLIGEAGFSGEAFISTVNFLTIHS